MTFLYIYNITEKLLLTLLYDLQHLNNLLENYLEPLKRETFLSNAEINALFGNIQEIVTFQRQFLQNLEDALEAEPNFHHFEFSNQFKVIYNLLRTVRYLSHCIYILIETCILQGIWLNFLPKSSMYLSLTCGCFLFITRYFS